MPRMQVNVEGTSLRTGASWAITSQWAMSALPSLASAQTAIIALRAALAVSAPFRAGIGGNYSLVNVKALGYTIPIGPATYTVEQGGAAVAGSGAQITPPLAVVVSELTGAAGGSYRGRSYWPGSGGSAPQSTDGIVTAPSQQAVRTSWLALHNATITALAAIGADPVHVVFSRKTGEMTPITVIRTGNRVDTARGRFGDDPEVYIAETVPGALSVDAEDLGLDPEVYDEASIQEIIDAMNAIKGAPITLGPLKQLLSAAKTVFELKSPPPAP